MPVQQRDIDAAVGESFLERNVIGFVEQVRVEHYRPVRPIGDLDFLRPLRRQPLVDPASGLVAIVRLKIPVPGRFLVPHHQSTTLRIQVRLIRRDPEIDVDRRGIGVDVQTAPGAVVLECPGLRQAMGAEDAGKPAA